MDKYVEEAFWMAMENAVRDRQKDSIRRILDQLEVLSSGVNFQRFDCKIAKDYPARTASAIFSLAQYLHVNGIMDEYLETCNSFTASTFRKWLVKQPFRNELNNKIENWESMLGKAITKYFCNPNSGFYKYIAQGEIRGSYKKCDAAPVTFSIPNLEHANV